MLTNPTQYTNLQHFYCVTLEMTRERKERLFINQDLWHCLLRTSVKSVLVSVLAIPYEVKIIIWINEQVLISVRLPHCSWKQCYLWVIWLRSEIGITEESSNSKTWSYRRAASVHTGWINHKICKEGEKKSFQEYNSWCHKNKSKCICY